MIPQPDELINVGNAVNAFLEWKSINGPPRSYLHYHPSEWGRCLRAAQYARYVELGLIAAPEDKSLDPRISRLFDTGHSMHHRWANYFTEMGVLRGYWMCPNKDCRKLHGTENKIGIFRPEKCDACGKDGHFHYHEITVQDKELNFVGHADQILDFSNFDGSLYTKGNPVKILFDLDKLPKTPIVNDMKTINSNQFDPKGFSKGGGLPKYEHKIQLVIYINLLGLEYGSLIYENKDDSAVKIFQVDKNEELWGKIKEQAATMNEMVAEKLLPPPRPEKKDCYECKDCEFKPRCHSGKIWTDPSLPEKRQKFYNINVCVTT